MRFPLMRLLLVTVAAACAAACGPAPLANTFESPEALAIAVLAGYETGDAAALQQLALSEQEFAERVWSELPAARPERNLPLSYVWGDLRQKSAQSLAGLLDRHRGKAYELVSVSFGDRTAYASYAVHREAVFVVRSSDGTQTEERLCGSMIEQDGHWKVFSYVVDN